MQPQTMTLPPSCLTLGTCLCASNLVAAPHIWHHLNQIGLFWSNPTTGPGSTNLLFFSKLFGGFLVHHLWRRFPSGMTAAQADLMQYAVYDVRPGRLTPPPLHLQPLHAGSTRVYFQKTTSGFDTEFRLVCWVIWRGQQIYTVTHALRYSVSKCHIISVIPLKDGIN